MADDWEEKVGKDLLDSLNEFLDNKIEITIENKTLEKFLVFGAQELHAAAYCMAVESAWDAAYGSVLDSVKAYSKALEIDSENARAKEGLKLAMQFKEKYKTLAGDELATSRYKNGYNETQGVKLDFLK